MLKTPSPSKSARVKSCRNWTSRAGAKWAAATSTTNFEKAFKAAKVRNASNKNGSSLVSSGSMSPIVEDTLRSILEYNEKNGCSRAWSAVNRTSTSRWSNPRTKLNPSEDVVRNSSGGNFTSVVRTRFRISLSFLPQKGGVPLRSMYAMTPKLHRSHRRS